MKLIFLGTGSAFTVGNGNYHSNMLLEKDGRHRMLIDCGSDARFSLYELGLTYRDINAVYISHLHSDHVGGLEWLGFTTKFDAHCAKPLLFINEKLAPVLWNKVLAGGLSSLQGVIAELSTYFEAKPIKENASFTWEEIDFTTVKTTHIMSGFAVLPSYGLLFTANGFTVLITTDTQFYQCYLMNFYQMADVIFHDCETAVNRSGVHAHYDELMTLDPAIRQKIWLYHYNPGDLPGAKKDGFRGFVTKGQCFDFDKPDTFK